MEECPHCGEPLEADAESCPHCGSDFETGWKPDTDYYSVELPEDEPGYVNDDVPGPPEVAWEHVASLFLVFLCGVMALFLSYDTHGGAVLPFAIALGVSLWAYYRGLTPRRAPR